KKAAKAEVLSAVKLSADKDSVILPGSYYILVTKKKLEVTIKKTPVHEPRPVKIQPMWYKDNALIDIQYLDIGQGLQYSYINSICQDKNGYIWIASDYGLSKYDGTYLTTYTEKEGLPDKIITHITTDDQNRLWISTIKGVCVFDGNSFLQFSDNEKLLSSFSGRIIKDSKGKMWVELEGKGLLCVEGKKFTIYNSYNNFQEVVSPDKVIDENGFLWFNTPGGIINYNNNRYSYFNPGSHILERITAVREDKKGNAWFISYNYGVTKFDGSYFTHYEKKNGLSDNAIISLTVDKMDNVWIGTRYNGLNKFDGSTFTIYTKEQGLSENKIICSMHDGQGNIWIGTAGGGINKLNENGFTEIIPLTEFKNSRIRPIIKDKRGDLWFGTEASELYSFDGSKLTKHLERNINNIQGFRSAIMDKDNNLWFGKHEGGGIYKYDYKQLCYYSTENIESSMLSLFEDNNRTMWMGTSLDGAGAFNGSIINYYNEAFGFSGNRVFVVRQDKKNNLWFGTEEGGLVKYDGKMFTVFSEKQGLFAKSITSITEDEKGNLWLGTLDAGLCKFDTRLKDSTGQGSSFTYYGEKQGLAFNAVWSLKEDANGQIWVGTDNGLSVLVPQKDSAGGNNKSYKVYSFGLQDGLKATDFNLNGVCIDNDNRIWWGTGKALITRDLNTSFNTYKPYSLNIKRIEINDAFCDFKNLSASLKNKIRFDSVAAYQNYPAQLSLPYNFNHLTFHFAAIEWQSPHKIKYSYRLIGSDNKWSNPSSQTTADFRNLSYGAYELQVKAIGESNEWTDAFTYKFSIRPAWWQTWWFKIIAFLLSVFTLFLITRFIYLLRLRKQKAQLEKQLAVQLERQRISAEMHDDIGAGLSGVRLLTELTKNKIKDERASGDMEKIYQSVGDISARMKEVIWSLNAENDNLDNLIHFLVKQVKAQLEHYPAEVKINIPASVPVISVSGEARRNIYLAVKEAVNNIIKHSGTAKVELEITCDEQLKISIADNGKGVNPDSINDAGNGLKNMRQRMKTLGGKMEIKNTNGFIITFEIPLTKEI
ncbi:MAG: ATP-binding protein, partial [Sphingobacteriales bacterium]|nr:ATP-binding protein [Sphingobacteriales bacterium]